jgi:hypothetical protein
VSNALKAQIIVAINAVLGLVVAFGVSLTDAQQGAITVAANALLGVWVAVTYKASPMRKK